MGENHQPLRKEDKASVVHRRSSPPVMLAIGVLAWMLVLPLPLAIIALMSGLISRISYELFLWGWHLLGMVP